MFVAKKIFDPSGNLRLSFPASEAGFSQALAFIRQGTSRTLREANELYKQHRLPVEDPIFGSVWGLPCRGVTEDVCRYCGASCPGHTCPMCGEGQ